MKLQHVALFSTLCAAPFLLTACNNAQVVAPTSAASMAPRKAEVHRLKNGVKVEVLPMEQNDLADLINAKLWKFRVSSDDKRGRMLVGSLKLMQHGKIFTGGFGIAPFTGKATEVVVAIQFQGKSWKEANTFKVNVRMRGNSGSNTFANSFKTSRILLTDTNFQDDGAILLLAGNGKKPNVSSSANANAVSLLLTFITQPLAHAK